MSPDLLTDVDVVYPESDGLPMGENTIQVRWINLLLNGFEALYEPCEDVFVAADLFWYPVEGDPRTATAPDLMVAFGRPKGDRRSYRQWQEGGLAPQVVWEILSPSNTYAEMQKKFRFYDHFGVEEYYIYDPDSYRLDVGLRTGGSLKLATVSGRYVSPRMGVRIAVPGTDPISLFHPNGQPFLSYLESLQRAEANERLAKAERRKAETSERLAETERQRADKYAERMRKLGIDPDQD